MSFEMKEGQGSLFKAKEKKNEKSPDYTGKVMVNGKILQIAGWKKTTKDGEGWLSLSISEPKKREDF